MAVLLAFASSSLSRAAEVPLEGGSFDDSIAGWSWEDWSAAGSSAAHDASLDSNSSATSGSLRLNSNFAPGTAGWQQAVYTVPLPAELNAGETYNSISFDLKVDPASTMRLEGDYGSIQVILRNGDNWDWAELDFHTLDFTSTDWTRVTASFDEATGPIDSVRGITIRVAQSDMQGPVMLNIDNIVFSDEVIIQDFDTGTPDTAPAGWTWENWSAPGTVMWEAEDAQGRATSGSVQLESSFENVAGYQQAVYTYQLPAQVNAAVNYSHINLDVKVDPSSTPRAGGDYGFFEIILRNSPTWEWVATGPAETTGTRLTSTDWTRISMPIRSGDQVNGITFKLGDNGFQGPVTLNIDNISWTENTEPPPPPSLEIARAQSGLNLVTTGTGQYDRHNIHSADTALIGWYDSPEPVTYEFSLLSYPDATEFPGFQAHLFLVPGASGSSTAPDWDQPSLIFLDLRAGEGGTGAATLRWKNNEPGGNSQLYAAGHSNVTSATILGTWKVTVSENTHFTVTAPDGSTTEFDLPAEAASSFANAIRLYVGAQPNATPNIGQSIRIGHVKVTQGSTVLLEDDFSGESLDESKWVANAPTGGVQLIPPDEAGFVISWGLPDSGFYLQRATSLTNPDWTGVPAAPVNLGPLMRQVHVPGSELPGDMAFFRLVQPEAVAPADHNALAANTYTLTTGQDTTWDLALTVSDETTGTYTFGETGQSADSGSYVVTPDLSSNRWDIELTSFFGGVETLSLEFDTASSGTWTYTGQLGSSTGSFESTPVNP